MVHDDEGLPFTVKYHLLSSMLLNELQKVPEQHSRELEAHERELEELRARLTSREGTNGSAAAPPPETP